MKNLLIYINPRKDFDEESKILVKIQIDNSLELGWKPEDIILVTNFPYEYRGVRGFIIGDENFNPIFPLATKIDAIVNLFDIGFIHDELYWCHDLEAFQAEVITEKELELEGFDIGLTDYGRKERWNGGSYFFRKNCNDIFHYIKEQIYANKINEEDVLVRMTNDNYNNVNSRIKRLNITYNFGVRKVKICYEKAIKPIKVFHFHPYRIYWGKTRAIDIMVYGKNELRKPIVNERIIKLLQKYGYT